MKKQTFTQQPALVEFEGETVRINFDVEEVPVTATQTEEGASVLEGQAEEENRTVFEANVVRVPHPVTRSRVIDAIVTAAYPADVMQSIVNNHLVETEGENAEHENEFAAMQQWRAHAKEIAAQVMENI